MSAWIRMLSDDEADDRLRGMLDKARTPHGTVDTVMRVHSLRPATMEGHVTLYRSVLHSDENTLPFWFLEIVASYTSILNDCSYSLTHHFANVRDLLKDEAKADRIFLALKAHRPEEVFEGRAALVGRLVVLPGTVAFGVPGALAQALLLEARGNA